MNNHWEKLLLFTYPDDKNDNDNDHVDFIEYSLEWMNE